MKIAAIVLLLLCAACGCPRQYAHDSTGLHWIEERCADGRRHFVRWVDLPAAPTEH